jgi:type II secretory pathway component PulF
MKPLHSDDVIDLLEELAEGARADRPLPEALDVFAEAEGRTRVGRVAGALAGDVASGRTLSEAIAARAGTFPPGMADLVRAGERSGELAVLLDDYADCLARQSSFGNALGRTMIYPIVVAAGCLGLLLLFKATIAGPFRAMYGEREVSLPVVTQLTLQSWSVPFLLMAAFLAPVLVVSALYVLPCGLLRNLWWLDTLRMHLPGLGYVERRALLTRWCAAVGPLLSAGVPAPDAVEVAGAATGSPRARYVSDVVAQRVREGNNLAEMLSEFAFFPAPLVFMVRGATQKTHRLIWPAATELFGRQAETAAHLAATILGVFMLFMALGLVGFVVQACMLPLVQLMNQL